MVPSPHVRVASPFPEFSLPRVWAWTQEFRLRVCDDFAPSTIKEFMVLWRAKLGSVRSWGVYRGEELGGVVTFEAASPVMGITHFMFKKPFWGHETTVPALEAVFGEVFESGVNKISSFAFLDNVQVLHLARQLGAQKEGVLRQQTVRSGEYVDMMAIGLLKADFEAKMATQRKEA